MEIDVTKLFYSGKHNSYCGSVHQLGESAAEVTWSAACADAESYDLLTTPEQLQAMRKALRSTGGWNDEEIAAFTDQELNALLVQMVSGAIWETSDMDISNWDWDWYQVLCEEGIADSSLLEGYDGKVYYLLSDY